MTMARHYYLGKWIWESGADGEFWRAPTGTVGLVDLRPLSPTSESGFFACEERLGDETGYQYLGSDLYGENLSAALISEWKARLQIGDAIAPCTLLDLLWDTLTIYSDPDGAVRTLPLMPTHRGILELHLGGHSLVKSARWAGEKTLHWDKVQKVLRRTFKELGRIDKIDKKDQKDQKHRLKWLGAMSEKYRVDSDSLIPEGMEKEKPEKPATKLTDNFNRVDQTNLGESAEGWSWDTTGSRTDIVNNQAKVNVAAAHTYRQAQSNLSSDDNYSRITIVNIGSAYTGALARFNGSTGYFGFFNTTYNRVYKVVSGTQTLLAESSRSRTTPFVVFFKADGSSIYGKDETYNDEISATDSSIASGLRGGFYCRLLNAIFDDFECGDLLASSVVARAMHLRRMMGVS